MGAAWELAIEGEGFKDDSAQPNGRVVIDVQLEPISMSGPRHVFD